VQAEKQGFHAGLQETAPHANVMSANCAMVPGAFVTGM
jgi:hypothetical protein